MPETAFLVGQGRIHRGVVEIEQFITRIALVVLRYEICQSARDRRAVALGDIAHAGVDCLLRLYQAFLRIGFVVEGNNLHFLAEDATFRIQFVSEKLEGLQAGFSDAGTAAGERVDVADFDALLRERCAAEYRQEGRNYHPMTHGTPP